MLAASYWSLLAPAIGMAEESGKYGAFAVVPVAVGFTLGAAFVYLADLVMPMLVRHTRSPYDTPVYWWGLILDQVLMRLQRTIRFPFVTKSWFTTRRKIVGTSKMLKENILYLSVEVGQWQKGQGIKAVAHFRVKLEINPSFCPNNYIHTFNSNKNQSYKKRLSEVYIWWRTGTHSLSCGYFEAAQIIPEAILPSNHNLYHRSQTFSD